MPARSTPPRTKPPARLREHSRRPQQRTLGAPAVPRRTRHIEAVGKQSSNRQSRCSPWVRPLPARLPVQHQNAHGTRGYMREQCSLRQASAKSNMASAKSDPAGLSVRASCACLECICLHARGARDPRTLIVYRSRTRAPASPALDALLTR